MRTKRSATKAWGIVAFLLLLYDNTGYGVIYYWGLHSDEVYKCGFGCGFVFNATVHDNWLHACDWKIMDRSHFITWRTYKHIFVVKCHANCLPDCHWVINWNVLMFFEYSWLCGCFDRWRFPEWARTAQELTRFVIFLDLF